MTASRTLALLTFAVLAGCGGSNSSSPTSATASSATDGAATPAATDAVATPFASSHHSRHHRRHHHGSSSGSMGAAPATTSGNATGAYPCDDKKFVAIQGEFASGALEGDQEVDVCGTVTRVLAARTTRSGLHGYYYVQVAPGNTIEIVSDLGEMDAPAWPWVKTGDYSTVRGRYYYDSATSQGIDWTHHGTSRSWPAAGYVVVGGMEYQ